jgi:hypothetical protein
MLTFSRREFLKNSSGFLGGITLASSVVRGATVTTTRFSKVRTPPDCRLPVVTGAAEISGNLKIPVVPLNKDAVAGTDDIVLMVGDDIQKYSDVLRLLPKEPPQEEWELVEHTARGLLIAGKSPRNVCHAALAWIANPAGETDRFSRFRFEERFTMWDNTLNQFYRFSKGFDRQKHIREIALLGHTGVEINRYADPGGYHVSHRKFPQDSYAWYLSYAPALDAFVESSLTKGIYPPEELAANLADLREAAGIARRYGLKPGFVCYEPRCVAEEIFDRHPQLRGSRTDHPGRSLQPRYALDIANPRVLDHYAELLTNLMQVLPDLRYLVFWTGDSGSGIPFASRLYFGPNGSYLARSKTLEQMARDFSGTLLTAGRKINPEFEVIMEISWEYTEEERRRIIAALPEGVSVSHHLGGRLLEGGDFGEGARYVEEDRKTKIEPYVTMVVSNHWDAEPVIGIPAPSVLLRKFASLKSLALRKMITHGGILSPPQCPYSLNQRLYSELLRGEITDLDSFLLDIAGEWCQGDQGSASLLVKAWKKGDEAMEGGPSLNWYFAGPGQTQGRWITRPVVPDMTRLSEKERSAWERSLFTLPWDVGRQNIVFEGGIRMYREEDLERAVKAYDENMLPRLAEAIGILEQALKLRAQSVVQDQRDRFQSFLLRERTVRNLFEAQVAINYYLTRRGDPKTQRQRLQTTVQAEIGNTRDWIRLLMETKTAVFRVTETQETPFLYKTPLQDLELKLAAMQKHIDDEPGPRLAELFSGNSEANLLFYDGCGTLERTK